MVQSTVFRDDKSQSVVLPKEVAFPDSVKRVDIVKLGQARLIAPRGTLWDSFFDGPSASEDYMADREQPSEQERSQ